MKRFAIPVALVLCAGLLGLPGAPRAQDEVPPPEGAAPEVPQATTPDEDAERGAGLIEEGARLMLRSLLDQAGPQLDELQGKIDEMAAVLGPALTQLVALIDDIANYAPPERLPNGDIILRRKPPAPPQPMVPAPGESSDGTIDL